MRTPHTPPRTPHSHRPHTFDPPSSPILPSPDDLHNFLTYAENDCGIRDATSYESPLRRKDFGPDILHRVADTVLTAPDIGITPGNAIRLKDASITWYNSSKRAGSKRKRSTIADGPSNEPEPAAKQAEHCLTTNSSEGSSQDWVRYEQRWPDGGEGGRTWCDAPPIPGTHKDDDDRIWLYSAVHRRMIPLPEGMTAHPTDQEREAAKEI